MRRPVVTAQAQKHQHREVGTCGKEQPESWGEAVIRQKRKSSSSTGGTSRGLGAAVQVPVQVPALVPLGITPFMIARLAPQIFTVFQVQTTSVKIRKCLRNCRRRVKT